MIRGPSDSGSYCLRVSALIVYPEPKRIVQDEIALCSVLPLHLIRRSMLYFSIRAPSLDDNTGKFKLEL
jgi:hypothetical protein